MHLPPLTIEDIVEHIDCANGQNPALLEKLRNLLRVYYTKPICSLALTELRDIMNSNHSLDTVEVSSWLKDYEHLGKNTLGMFLIDYLDHNDKNERDLTILPEGITVSRAEFIPIIQFCEVFQIIYWNLELHLPAEKRTITSPLDYYQSKGTAYRRNTILGILGPV